MRCPSEMSRPCLNQRRRPEASNNPWPGNHFTVQLHRAQMAMAVLAPGASRGRRGVAEEIRQMSPMDRVPTEECRSQTAKPPHLSITRADSRYRWKTRETLPSLSESSRIRAGFARLRRLESGVDSEIALSQWSRAKNAGVVARKKWVADKGTGDSPVSVRSIHLIAASCQTPHALPLMQFLFRGCPVVVGCRSKERDSEFHVAHRFSAQFSVSTPRLGPCGATFLSCGHAGAVPGCGRAAIRCWALRNSEKEGRADDPCPTGKAQEDRGPP